MKILAIETSTEACSAALLTDNQLFSRFELAPREHTKLIIPMMDELLAEAEINLKAIDAIAFGQGPGAFTGLRIATGVAQGVALAIDKPLIGISTLEALAWQVRTEANNGQKIITALDARMGELYWAIYQKDAQKPDMLIPLDEEQVSKPRQLLNCIVAEPDKLIATGIGWSAYKEALLTPQTLDKITLMDKPLPSAAAIAELALPKLQANLGVPAEAAQPVYIRDNVAVKTKDR